MRSGLCASGERDDVVFFIPEMNTANDTTDTFFVSFAFQKLAVKSRVHNARPSLSEWLIDAFRITTIISMA